MSRIQRILGLVCAMAGALSVSTQANAQAYAVAYNNILNLVVTSTDENNNNGPLYIPLSDFTVFSAFSGVSANLNGSGAGGSDTGGGPVDAPPAFGTGSVFPGVTPANNDMTPVGQAGNYSRSDAQVPKTTIQQVIPGGPVTVTGTTTQAWGIVEGRIAASGNADSDSRNASETEFNTTITLNAPAKLVFNFQADPYMQVALSPDSASGVANAVISVEISVTAAGTSVFEWIPDGQPGGITGGQELADGGNLNGSVEVSSSGASSTYDPTADDSAGAINPPAVLSYGARTDTLPAGTYTIALDMREGVNVSTIQAPPVVRYDLGDNPDATAGTGSGNYQTRFADGGARHQIAGPYLGLCVDADDGTFQNIPATADDLIAGVAVGTCNGDDDEDGVTLPASVSAGQSYEAVIYMPGGASAEACVVDGWIDFNSDGVFDNGVEKIVAQSFAAGSGATPVSFTVPADAASGPLYSRFRCSRSGMASAVGDADNGEVEDFRISQLQDVPVPTMSYLGLGMLALMLSAIVALRRQNLVS
jgi:hypothetical protein